MNFTREPIIETIISPKEGYKLIVRNSSGENQEEYSVDAVEVVSFGKSFFFRSLERPKSFLLPVGKYEVVEAKETRMVLKKATVEKSIKIAGGKAPRSSTNRKDTSQADSRQKKERRKPKKKSEERTPAKGRQTSEKVKSPEGGDKKDEAEVSSSGFKSLLPPPTRLISENIGRYKSSLAPEATVPTEEVESSPDSRSEELFQEEESMPTFSFDEEVEKQEEAIVPMKSPEEELPFEESDEKDRDILNEEGEEAPAENKQGEGYSIE